ncbi:MAG: bifunctional transaldolase/phosoglucose isomerase [Chloroflexota bacterium]
MSHPAIEVQAHGQSLWLDYIHRAELESGEFQRRLDEDGIRGVTSNPSIFRAAMGDSDTYDEAMSALLDLAPMQVYEALAIADIQKAADMLRPIYDASDGQDGYVSLEVSPELARDTDGTLAEAKRLFAEVNRPNVMIKIPGTEEGIPAIEEAIATGINVNITLLFSVANYEQVAEAYIKGLERRLEAGEDVSNIASVASFFLSRIDTAVDRILKNNIRSAQVHHRTALISANRKLLGQAAVANAKLAYQSFQRLFKGTRFKKLAQAGAMVQRPLWASTSTKDPAYSDTRYVDAIIGQDTVNTVPPKTLMAFINHGTVEETLTRDIDNFMPPDVVMQKLSELGIDMDMITARLQVDGVDAFRDDFETLIQQVEAKLTVLRTGVMDRQKLALGIYAANVNKAIAKVDKDFVNERIWSKDGSLWTSFNPDIIKIERRLGWLDVLETIDIKRLKTLQADIKQSDISDVVLLGMGGSSLVADVLWRIFGQQADFPAFTVLDSTNPIRIRQVEDSITLDKTLFIVASKSGITIETLSFYRYFYEKTGNNGAQFLAITDPDTALATLAQENNFRDSYLNPADIGGRYSALSYFGMIPAAVMGLDLDALWASAKHMIDASHEHIPGQYHPGVSLGVVMATLAQEGRDKVTIHSTKSLHAFGDWAEQLIGESLGKEGIGIIPVSGSDVAPPSEYSTDRLFLYLRLDDDDDIDEMDTKIRTVREAGHPRLTMRVPNKYAVAAEFFRWEFGTAVAGHCKGINPFDEPHVSEAKAATNAMLEHYTRAGKLPPKTPIISGEHTEIYLDEHTATPLRELCRAHGYDPNSRTEVLAAQMAGTHAGDYFGLLVYFTPTPEEEAKLHEIRGRLRSVTKRAVTVGYGPRYLHSTGQLHKGGRNNGIFFYVTTPHSEDIDIPETPYSFGILNEAQMLGDVQTLQKHKRRVIRLHTEETPMSALDKLIAAIKFVEDRRF